MLCLVGRHHIDGERIALEGGRGAVGRNVGVGYELGLAVVGNVDHVGRDRVLGHGLAKVDGHAHVLGGLDLVASLVLEPDVEGTGMAVGKVVASLRELVKGTLDLGEPGVSRGDLLDMQRNGPLEGALAKRCRHGRLAGLCGERACACGRCLLCRGRPLLGGLLDGRCRLLDRRRFVGGRCHLVGGFRRWSLLRLWRRLLGRLCRRLVARRLVGQHDLLGRGLASHPLERLRDRCGRDGVDGQAQRHQADKKPARHDCARRLDDGTPGLHTGLRSSTLGRAACQVCLLGRHKDA